MNSGKLWVLETQIKVTGKGGTEQVLSALSTNILYQTTIKEKTSGAHPLTGDGVFRHSQVDRSQLPVISDPADLTPSSGS